MKKISFSFFISACLGLSAAAELVPGGDFQMYKPDTNYTVSAEFASGYAKGVGDGLSVINGSLNYSDSTTGTTFDLPGRVSPVEGTNNNDLLNNGIDGSTGLNVFGVTQGIGRRRGDQAGRVGNGISRQSGCARPGPPIRFSVEDRNRWVASLSRPVLPARGGSTGVRPQNRRPLRETL